MADMSDRLTNLVEAMKMEFPGSTVTSEPPYGFQIQIKEGVNVLVALTGYGASVLQLQNGCLIQRRLDSPGDDHPLPAMLRRAMEHVVSN